MVNSFSRIAQLVKWKDQYANIILLNLPVLLVPIYPPASDGKGFFEMLPVQEQMNFSSVTGNTFLCGCGGPLGLK